MIQLCKWNKNIFHSDQNTLYLGNDDKLKWNISLNKPYNLSIISMHNNPNNKNVYFTNCDDRFIDLEKSLIPVYISLAIIILIFIVNILIIICYIKMSQSRRMLKEYQIESRPVENIILNNGNTNQNMSECDSFYAEPNIRCYDYAVGICLIYD